MKSILFLLLVFLPIVFSIDQISDDQTQSTMTDSTSTEVPQISQAESKDVEDNNQAPPQTESSTPQSDPQLTETAPQTTPQETKNEEKSTTSVKQTPSPISDEAPKSTPAQTSAKTKTDPQNPQVYVSEDDNSSCKGLCLGGGVCKNDVCICPPGFSGARCEVVFDANKNRYQKKMDAVVTKYYYAMIGFLGLVAVMVLSEFCCKGGSESAPKEDVSVDQGQKYVDLDLEAGGPIEDKNYADVEADVAPVQEEPEEVVPVQEEQNYVEPEVAHVEEEKNYPEIEPEVVQVEEEQNNVEPEAVVQAE